MWRQLYRSAISPESFPDDLRLRRLMGAPASGDEGNSSGMLELAERLGRWRAEQTAAYRALAARAASLGNEREFVETLLIHSAPMASVLGCWLQGMSAPGVFEDDAQLKLLALLAQDVGVGRPHATAYDHFKAMLIQVGLGRYAVAPFELSAAPGLSDEAFELPALLLALSRRSDEFGDLLCGIDQALRRIGLCPCWAALGQLETLGLDTRRLDLNPPVDAGEQTTALAISCWVGAQVAAWGPARRRQLEGGASWLFAAVQRWNARLYDQCLAAVSPAQAMGRLVQRLARAGAVYHHDYPFEGRSLSEWLEEAQHQPAPFLAALSRSRLIVPGNSARSLLVTSLVAPSARMFRIFSEADLNVIRLWIDALPDAAQAQALPVPAGVEEQRSPPRDPEAGGGSTGRWPRSLRDAYFLLQGRALGPRTQAFAQAYVARWLGQSRRSLRHSRRGLPEQWAAGALHSWLLDQHDRHGRAFAHSDPAALPPREEIVDQALQLAPLTLIDGAWLQGFCDLRLAASQVGYALFQTYWDELGNGRYRLNHPKIYRDGLRQMGIELAPTGSREFAEDPRLREESFRLAVYWLCLGKLPVTFMPEILGMNLAMELSGVGGSYRSARRFLKHYGFSTDFVDLHNSIDNVCTGHSAWAAEAIDAYMRKIAGGGRGELAEHWLRVRVGYESLAPTPGRLTGLLRRLGIGAAADRLPHTRDRGAPQGLFHHAPITRPQPAEVAD